MCWPFISTHHCQNPGWRLSTSLNQCIEILCRFVLAVLDGISLCCMDPRCCWLRSVQWISSVDLCTQLLDLEKERHWAMDFHVCLCLGIHMFISPWRISKNMPNKWSDCRQFLSISERKEKITGLKQTLNVMHNRTRSIMSIMFLQTVKIYFSHQRVAGRWNREGQRKRATPGQQSHDLEALTQIYLLGEESVCHPVSFGSCSSYCL